MSDNTPESNQDSGSDTSSETKSFSEKYSDVMGKVNETLGNVDWTQMGKYGKAAGIIAVVVIAQIIIKVVIDTINFFPILPGLLELLGVIVVGQWRSTINFFCILRISIVRHSFINIRPSF